MLTLKENTMLGDIPGEKAAVVKLVGPVIDVFAGVVQSTWNFHTWSVFVPKLSR